MSSSGWVIEFFGPSGVGKSTLARAVARLLGERGVTVRLVNWDNSAADRSRTGLAAKYWRWGLMASFLLRNPGLGAKLFLYVVRSRQQSSTDARVVLKLLFERSALLKRAHNVEGIHISDEGVYQAIWAFLLSARRESADLLAGKLCLTVPKPHVLVILEADTPTIELRLRGRPGNFSRIEQWLHKDPTAVERGVSLFYTVKGMALHQQAAGGFDIINLDNTVDYSHLDNAMRIVTIIEDRLRTHSEGD